METERYQRGRNEKHIERETRVPLGAPRLKLKVDEKPGVVRRWINDKDSRLLYAEEGGYRYVERLTNVGTPDVIPGNTDLGSRTSKVVGTNEDGTPLRAYLMEIDHDDYVKDQEAKEEAILATEDTIRNGNLDGKASDGRYIPSEGIRMRT